MRARQLSSLQVFSEETHQEKVGVGGSEQARGKAEGLYRLASPERQRQKASTGFYQCQNKGEVGSPLRSNGQENKVNGYNNTRITSEVNP